MSAKEYALDALTRHQIYLQRYNTGEVKKMLPFLTQMLKDVKRRVLVADTSSLARLTVLEQDLSMIITGSMQKLNKQLLIDLNDLGEYEAGFTQRMLNNIVHIARFGLLSTAKISTGIRHFQSAGFSHRVLQ